MTWTKTKPSAPGWYWRKCPQGFEEIVLIEEHHDGLFVRGIEDEDSYPMSDGDQFAGPIPKPEEPSSDDTVIAGIVGPDGTVQKVPIKIR